MRSFQSALSEGHAAERRWVEDLRSIGRSVAHGKKLVVRKHCKRTGHVECPDALALVSIEVKERSVSFTSPEDYPYDTVFVDDIRGMELEPFGNLIYVYISKPTGKWVWLCMLDKDADWRQEVAYDRGRGHEVPVLVAPKRCLRPAWQLIDVIYPHLFLDLVDGDTGAFISGGGQTEERERYVAKTHPDFAPRVGANAAEVRKHMG